MNRKTILACTCVGLGVLCFVPADVFAETTNTAFGGNHISAEATKIKEFIFGAPMRFAGILGGGYGVLQAVLTSSVKPLIIFGGIGMGINVIPKFIDGVFSMMLP
jgi:hypothetical protein